MAARSPPAHDHVVVGQVDLGPLCQEKIADVDGTRGAGGEASLAGTDVEGARRDPTGQPKPASARLGDRLAGTVIKSEPVRSMASTSTLTSRLRLSVRR